jgi:conjugative relaxase-like TrwC/TraI family protein
MLTISRPLSSGQAQRYHAEEFTNRVQFYYAEGENVRGEWQGRLASDLGLKGEVSADDFARMSEGKHPRTGEQLVEQRLPHEYKTADGKTVKTMGHRAGWDATFSAPKSVSLTALVGGDERVREAHREAVRVAVDKMETYVQARMGGNRAPENTHNWAVAKFEHDTSRPVDGYAAPQLHTHAVFFNMTETSDGEFRAIQSKELYRSQQYGTAVYRSELAWRVNELGYQLEVGKNGAPEIKGYSREYLEANSPRSQQIQEHLKEAGLSGAGPAQIAAHRTREEKLPLDRNDVRAQHRAVAEAHGDQPSRVVREARERGPAQTQDPARHAHAAVTYARDKCFEREAVVDQRELMKEALKHASGKAPSEHVSRAFEERVKRGDLTSVARDQPGSASKQYTTPATIANERRNIEHMREGQDRCRPLVSDKIASEAARSERLNQSQQRVVRETLSNRDRIFAVQGVAGSGKTTTLREIRIAAQRDGYQVRGLAPTSRAASQLEEAGVSSTTLQRQLAQPTSESRGQGHLYMVDESSLVSTRQTGEFLDRLGPNDRVIMIGDTRQHQAVDAGRPFEQLQDAGMRMAKLDEIVRQKDPELKQVVDDLAHGRVREAVSELDRQGRVHEIPDRNQRFDAIARDYADSPGRTLVVAPDNQSRRELNDHIRQELKDRSVVGRDDHKASVLVPRQDMTGADRAWAAQYREGDVIRYTRGSHQLGVKPGEYATVREVDARQNRLKVERSDGTTKEYDPRRLRGVAVYEKAERTFSEGDRVQMTAPHKAAGLANRELGTVERVDPSGDMKLRMDSGRTATVAADKPAHLDHGYAVTSHSAQGATADRIIVHAESGQSTALVNERFAYVAGSRMREGLDVYTDNSQGLTSSLERQFDKTAAVHGKEVAPRQGHGESDPGKDAHAVTARGEQQSQTVQPTSSGHGLGHGP